MRVCVCVCVCVCLEGVTLVFLALRPAHLFSFLLVRGATRGYSTSKAICTLEGCMHIKHLTPSPPSHCKYHRWMLWMSTETHTHTHTHTKSITIFPSLLVTVLSCSFMLCTQRFLEMKRGRKLTGCLFRVERTLPCRAAPLRSEAAAWDESGGDG